MTICLAVMATLAIASDAVAQETPGGSRRAVQDRVPPVDRSESRAAREAFVQARLNLMRAQGSVGDVQRFAEARLRATDEFKQLRTDVQRARNRWYELQRPVLELLREDDAYARLVNEKQSARQLIAGLIEEQKADYLTLLPHAKEAMEAGKKVSRAELIALALDPVSEAARQEFVAASRKLREAVAVAQRAAGESMSVKIAREEIAACEARVNETRMQLEEAIRQEEQEERDRQKKIDAIRAGKEVPPPPPEREKKRK